MDASDQGKDLTVSQVKNDTKKSKKWQKRVAKGDINVDANFLMASKIYGLKGEVSMKFNRENNVDNHLNVRELREIIQCLSHHNSLVPRSFTITNKAYVRRVVMLHFQDVEDPMSFLKQLSKTPVFKVRVSKHDKIPVPFPHKLLTIPFEDCTGEEVALINLPNKKKTEAVAVVPDVSVVGTECQRERAKIQGYILTPSLLSLWNYPLTLDYGSDAVREQHMKLQDQEEFSADSPPLKKSKLEPEEDSPVSTPEVSEDYEGKAAGVLHGKIPTMRVVEKLQEKTPTLFQKVKVFYNTSFPKNGYLVFRDFDQSVSETSPEYSHLWLSDVDKKPPLSFAAIDCEMVLTDDGDQIARVTLIGAHGGTVFDTYVKPAAAIRDYRTEFSGITEEIMAKTTVTMPQVILAIKRLVSRETTLIGHSLDSDLKALKFFHPNNVDTSILFPHPRGYPLRRKLKELAKEYLNMNIQVASKGKGAKKGHDSQEDALAALNLATYRFENKLELFDDEAIVAGSDIGISPGITMLSRLEYHEVDCLLSCYQKDSQAYGKNFDPIIHADKYWVQNVSIGAKEVFESQDNQELSKKLIRFLEKRNTSAAIDESTVKLDDFLSDKQHNRISFAFASFNGSPEKAEECQAIFQSLQESLKAMPDSTSLFISSQSSMDPINAERLSKKVLMSSTQLTTSTWNPTRENELKDKIIGFNQAGFSFSIL